MKKILIITPDFYPRVWWWENYMLNFSKSLEKKWYEIKVLVPNKYKQGIDSSFWFKIKYLNYYELFGNKFIKLFLLFKEIKKYNSDIVYISWPWIMDIFASWFWKVLRKKVFMTYHADLDLSKLSSRIFTKIYFKTCIPFVDRIIITTDKYKNILINRWVSKKKLRIVPVWIDLVENFSKSKNNKIQLLFVWMLDKDHLYKNIYVLLDTMKLLENNNFFLTIIWDWDKLDEYKKYADKLNLKNIEFVWKKVWKELDNFYQNSNIFILPSNSKKEWFWIVLLEALSKWNFIITWEKSWWAFILKENKKFWELYNWTSEDLKEKILKLSKMLDSFPQKNISSFLQDYKWNNLVDKIIE